MTTPPRPSLCTAVAWEFYDLKTDPHEMQNQYDTPEYKTIVETMKIELRQTRQDLHETDERYPEIKAIVDAHWQR